ncbi:MAG: hypothetical protein COB84_02270 [Rhodobacteraceae bacterium]|nr:MAG: hypothetical protein COB84_02270 [Paracoccaceae bacterium]
MFRSVISATIIALGFATTAFAQPVLTNGGFEQSPPNNYGNNINWSIAPWVLGAGQTNVVSVDGPGGTTWYGTLGPASDATGGVGNFQHYFDQANISGMGTISQEFTPKCTGEVSYGTYFSSRSNASGDALVSILDANGTVIAGPASVNVPAGNSETDPWQLAAFTASLTANTPYVFKVQMDNQLNMDNAYVAFETQCAEHTPPCFITGTCNTPTTDVEAIKSCEPATYNLDGSYDLNCTIDVTVDEPFPPQIVIYEQFSIGGSLAQLAINSASSSDAWSCQHSAVSPNDTTELSCVLNAADVPASGQTSIDVNLTIPADTDVTDVKNCASGKFEMLDDAGTDRIDESCVAIEFPEGPPPPNCAPFEQGKTTCDRATGARIITLTNSALPNFNPNDVRIVSITAGVTVSQNPNDPLELAVVGGTPGQVVIIKTEAIHQDGGKGEGVDLCCMGTMTITIPEDEPCEGPIDLSVQKQWQDYIDFAELGETSQQLPPHGFKITVDLPTGTLQAGDVITVNDPLVDQINVTSFGAPIAPAPWLCTQTGGAWSCNYTVPANGAILPVDIYWPAIKDGELHVKNCADADITRAGQSVGETTMTNNKSCWEENAPLTNTTELEIVKSGLEECRTGAPCEFTYTVSNTGNGDYTGPITLDDTVTNTPLSGQTSYSASGGGFTSISPALCAVVDLTSPAGCTGNVTIPAGGQQTFTVLYNPPAFDGEGDFAIENCVRMFDATMVVGQEAKQSCHVTQINKPQLEIVKSGPEECPIGQPCDFTVTITNASQAPYSGPVLLSDMTTVSQFSVSNVSPMPAGCGGNLPANPFACVTNISLAAGASTSYTMTMLPLSADGQVVAQSGENCAALGALPAGTQTGDYSIQYYGDGTPVITQAFADILQAVAPIGQSCVPLVITDTLVIEPNYQIIKACSEPTLIEGPAHPSWNVECEITINAEPAPTTGTLYINDIGQFIGGEMTLQSSDPWVCTGTGLTENCEIPAADFPATGSSVLTATVILTEAPEGGVFNNCATFSSSTSNQELGSCADVTIPPYGDDVTPNNALEVVKACTALPRMGANVIYNCTITVTATGPVPGPIYVHDNLTYSNVPGGDPYGFLGQMNSSDPWVCNPTPYTTSSGANCYISATDFAATGYSSTINTQMIVIGSDRGEQDIQNCAYGKPSSGAATVPSCVVISEASNQCDPVPEIPNDGIDNDCDGETDELSVIVLPPELEVSKTCSDVVVTEHAPQGVVQCSITITGANLPSGQIITLKDIMTAPNGAAIPLIGNFTNVSGQPASMTCSDTGNAAGDCVISSDDFNVNQPILLSWTSTINGDWDNGPDFENGEQLQNCASTHLSQDATTAPSISSPIDCAMINIQIEEDNTPHTTLPPISLEKLSTGKCSVNVAAQNYSCGFDLVVTNNGTAEFNAPMVLNDVFGAPRPTAIRGISGEGWNCTTKGREGSSCINGTLKLAPQETSTVSMQLTLPGQRSGGSFDNCGAIGVGDDPKQQAMIAQTALNQIGYDVGTVDGRIGPNTRKGLKGLQKQLGLDPTGELSDDFFRAIGLQMASDATPSCVTVDLPPMPKPPLVCQSSTTRKKGASCVCRYKNMYQKNKSSCGCVKGTRFVKGEGCRKVISKPKCGSNSTYVKGKGCVKKQVERKCPIGTINVKGLCLRLNIGIGSPRGGSCSDPTGVDC